MKFFKITLQKLAQIYWKLIKPKTLGSRLLLIQENKVLLVKHVYHNEWFLPGGGIRNKESFLVGLKRELEEELRLNVTQLNLFGIYQNNREGKHDIIVIFLSREVIDLDGISLMDSEIEKIVLADINNLPDNVSPGTKRRIEEFKSGDFPVNKPW